MIILAPVMILLIAAGVTGCKKDSNTTVPVVTTTAVTAIGTDRATGGGTVSSDGGGAITARGLCWSAERIPTMSDHLVAGETGTGPFTLTIGDLIRNTTYYVMAYATNSAGTGYGEVLSFTTEKGSAAVTDIDGNVYDTVRIGAQTWMVQNLRVTHYRNGDTIPHRKDNTQWCNFISGAYCNYSNDVDKGAVYGRLYNWYAVNDPRKIAPEGWHVATDAEWQALCDYLGGLTVAGGKLKEAGLTHWETPNTAASNESGFTGLPAGTRFGEYGIPGYGTFTRINKTAEWWTADEQRSWGISFDSGELIHNTDSRWTDGFSVRCIKDN